jgi:hypothetical protein
LALGGPVFANYRPRARAQEEKRGFLGAGIIEAGANGEHFFASIWILPNMVYTLIEGRGFSWL